MKGQIYNPGQPQKKESFDHSQDSLEESVRERMLDIFTPGILSDSQTNGESVPFEIAPDTGLQIRVNTGAAIAPHDVLTLVQIDAQDTSKAGGERVFIPVGDTTTIPANDYQNSVGGGPGTGTGTGVYTESPDGLGGWTSTPQSTKTRHIPVVNGAINRVWIAYLNAVDPTVASLHKVNISNILYTERVDGYEIVVNQSGTPPGGDAKYEFLGTVDLSLSPPAVTGSHISMANRRIAITRPLRVGVKFDPATLAPTATPIAGTTYEAESHVNSIGTGIVSVMNPHGLTLADLGFTQDVDLKSHRSAHHSNGLVTPSPLSTTTAIFPRTDTSTPVIGDAAMVFLKKLATNESMLVDGNVFLDSGVDPLYKLAVPTGGASAGDYFVSFGTSHAAGVYGIIAYQSGTLLQFEKRISPFSFNIATEYLVCIVEWSGTAFINPSPTGVQTDSRLFGTISARNVQVDAIYTGSIQNLAVTSDKLAANSVISSKILDLNVTTTKLGDGSVITQKLANLSVDDTKLADDSVLSVKLPDADGTSGQNTSTGSGVKTDHVQDDAMTSQKIAEWDLVSTAAQPNTGSGIATAHLKDGSVTLAKLDPTVVSGLGLGNTLSSKFRATTPSVSTVTVTADTLSIQGTVLNAVNVTANIAASGANGLDSGTESASTWYAVFVITDSTGSTSAGLLSLSVTPILPVGYTKYRRVAWVRNNASSDFILFTKVRDEIIFNDNLGLGILNPTGTTSLSSYFPPGVVLANFNAVGSSGATSTAFSLPTTAFSMRTDSGSSYLTMMLSNDFSGAGGAACAAAVSFPFRLTSSQTVDIQSGMVIYESGSYTIYPSGYTDDI